MTKTFKITIKRPTHTQTIYDTRISVVADIAEMSEEEIRWAIEEHCRAEFAWIDGAEATIEEVEL